MTCGPSKGADAQDDWDKSEDEKPKAQAAVAPPKKKLTLKQKLAEKERLAQEKVSGTSCCST